VAGGGTERWPQFQIYQDRFNSNKQLITKCIVPAIYRDASNPADSIFPCQAWRVGIVYSSIHSIHSLIRFLTTGPIGPSD